MSGAQQNSSHSLQQRTNEYLADPNSPELPPTSSRTGDTSATATENNDGGARNDGFDYEMQDYRSKKSNRRPSRARSSTDQAPHNDTGQIRQFPIQEVIPNTHMAAAAGADPVANRADNFGHGVQSRSQRVNSNVRDVSSAQPGGPRPPGEVAEDGGNEGDEAADGEGEDNDDDNKQNNHAFNAPLMVRPKTLYQNPQTPTVLPSTYHPINKWTILRDKHLKEFLGEFLGTMVMIIFGNGINCQVVAAAQLQQNSFEKAIKNLGNTPEQLREAAQSLPLLVSSSSGGTFDEVAAGWAAGTTMGYFTAGGSAVSGAHLNPSVTVANFIYRGFPFKKILHYIVGQILGAFVGALIMYIYYRKVIEEAYPGDWWKNENVANMFCVFPKPYLSTSRQFVSEFVSTALFQIGTFALTDPYTCLSSNLFPLMFFILLYVIIASFSYQTGAAMNMARDLGPRLALYAVGFNREMLWIKQHHFFWVPMVAPFIGSITGGLIYDICIYQGHESPVNWPISTYKDIFKTLWFKRTMWSRRSRWPAEDEKKNEQGFSDLENDSDEDNREGWDRPQDSNGKTGSSKSPFPQEDNPESVQFKSIKGKDGRYHSGIPTVTEENPSLERESFGGTSVSLNDTNGSNVQSDDLPSFRATWKKEN